MKLRLAKKLARAHTAGLQQRRRVAGRIVGRAIRRSSPKFPRWVRRLPDGPGPYWVDYGGGMQKAVNLAEWSYWFENSALRFVGHTQVGARAVSTVGLGLDHSFGFEEPVLYESAIIDFGPPYLAEPCERYSTREAALAGHARLVATLRVDTN